MYYTKSRDYGRWHWVAHLQCPQCGHDNKIGAGDTRRAPYLPLGAITCMACGAMVDLQKPAAPREVCIGD